MVRHSRAGFALLVLACTTAAPVGAASIGVETFSGGLAGFGPNTISSTVVHSAAGGNPDEHLLIRRIVDATFFDIGALTSGAAFTGDYAADGIGSAGVDLDFRTTNVSGAWLRVRQNAVTNGWLHALTGDFSPGWRPYDVAFVPTWTDLEARAAGWITDFDLNPAADPSPAFATVMANVGFFEVRLGSTNESTLVGLDNARLGGLQVPEPAAVATLLLGLAGLAARRRRQP